MLQRANEALCKTEILKRERQKEMMIKHRLTPYHLPPTQCHYTHHIPYVLQNGLNSMSLFDCEKTDKNKYFRGVQINFNPKS